MRRCRVWSSPEAFTLAFLSLCLNLSLSLSLSLSACVCVHLIHRAVVVDASHQDA